MLRTCHRQAFRSCRCASFFYPCPFRSGAHPCGGTQVRSYILHPFFSVSLRLLKRLLLTKGQQTSLFAYISCKNVKNLLLSLKIFFSFFLLSNYMPLFCVLIFFGLQILIIICVGSQIRRNGKLYIRIDMILVSVWSDETCQTFAIDNNK